LRGGIKFHDGTNLDAAAVKYNIDRIRDPKTNSIRGGEITALDTVTVVDAAPSGSRSNTRLRHFFFPSPMCRGASARRRRSRNTAPTTACMRPGQGPLRLAEYQKDSRTVLARNPTYWATGKPYLDSVVLRPIPTDSTRLAELRSGGVQLAEALPLQDIARLRQGQELVVSEKVGFRWEYFGFNLREQYPGHNKKFRQAFQWAIDREALHRAAYFGTGAVGYDGILPGSPFHDANYRPFKTDMDRAKAADRRIRRQHADRAAGATATGSGQAARLDKYSRRSRESSASKSRFSRSTRPVIAIRCKAV
jgi:peptide/nickel transport system substrate-binding protein